MKDTPSPAHTFAAFELDASVALLATMSDLCVQVLQRIAAGDAPRVYPLSDQLRLIRSGLADLLVRRIDSFKTFEPATPLEARQLEQLRLGVRIVATFDRAHAEWSQSLPDPEVSGAAHASIHDWHALLEKRLPMQWDLKRDLLAILGLPPEELILALEERGQERVMVFLQPKAKSPLLDPPREPPLQAIPPQKTKPLLGARSLPNTEEMNHELSLLDAAFAANRLRRVETIEQAKQLYFFREPPRFQELLCADPSIADDFRERVRGELESLLLIANVGQNTARRFGPRWFNQGLDNLQTIAECSPLAELRGRYAGVPAVLVSPGPSLDRNIAHLKGIHGKALLVAPGQSIRRLHEEGIYPDFVAVIDPQDLTSQPFPFFDPALIRSHQALLAGATCHPNVLRLPYPRKYVFGSSTSAAWIDAIFGDAHVSIGGGSVAVAALNMLIEWGCNPIVLVGQDLAYSEGRQYAGGFRQDPKVSPQPANLMKGAVFEVEGYYGGKVRTPYGYRAALYEMETIAERLASLPTSPTVINATEGGAHIRGFAKQPLEEVLRHLAVNPGLATPVWSVQGNDPLAKRKRWARAQTQLRQARTAIEELVTRAGECADLCQRIQKRQSSRLLDRLAKSERRMRSALRAVGFLSLAVQEEVELIQKAAGNQTSLAENLEASDALYGMILSACKTAFDKIGVALEGMDSGDGSDSGGGISGALNSGDDPGTGSLIGPAL